jgi:hypothetical protein
VNPGGEHCRHGLQADLIVRREYRTYRGTLPLAARFGLAGGCSAPPGGWPLQDSAYSAVWQAARCARHFVKPSSLFALMANEFV